MQSHFVPIAYNSTSSSLQERLFQQWIYLTQVGWPCLLSQRAAWQGNPVGLLRISGKELSEKQNLSPQRDTGCVRRTCCHTWFHRRRT